MKKWAVFLFVFSLIILVSLVNASESKIGSDESSFLENVIDFLKERFGFGEEIRLSPLPCGTIISEDTTLDRDIICDQFQTGGAVIIGNRDIILDCAGHRIVGGGAINSIGISVNGWLHDNIVIKNCIIENFFEGIEISNNHDGQIIDNIIINGDGPNSKGIYLTQTVSLYRIEGNEITGYDYGIYWWDGHPHDLTFDSNIINFNRAGIYGYNGGSDNEITNNILTKIPPYDPPLYAGVGIDFGGDDYATTSGTTISNNEIINTTSGIRLNGRYASANTIAANIIASNDSMGGTTTGIFLGNSFYNNNNNITGNTIIGHHTGIELYYSMDNNLVGNTFLNNGLEALETGQNLGNNWNNSDQGNYWSNTDNEGFPDNYTVFGFGDGVDYLPNWLDIECLDEDEDGYSILGGGTCCGVSGIEQCAAELDCNDNNPDINPGAEEICDGLDNDCNPATSDGSDELGFGDLCDGDDSDLCDEGNM
ncbi:MAG: right-handed parallel beta-helix repeat-containing protein, partial [archaeon]